MTLQILKTGQRLPHRKCIHLAFDTVGRGLRTAAAPEASTYKDLEVSRPWTLTVGQGQEEHVLVAAEARVPEMHTVDLVVGVIASAEVAVAEHNDVAVDEHIDVAVVEHTVDRKSTRLNSSHRNTSRMPSSA